MGTFFLSFLRQTRMCDTCEYVRCVGWNFRPLATWHCSLTQQSPKSYMQPFITTYLVSSFVDPKMTESQNRRPNTVPTATTVRKFLSFFLARASSLSLQGTQQMRPCCW